MERQITCTGLVLVVSLLAAGCAGAGKDNTPVLDFQQAQAVWQAHGIDSYEVTVWQSPFVRSEIKFLRHFKSPLILALRKTSGALKNGHC